MPVRVLGEFVRCTCTCTVLGELVRCTVLGELVRCTVLGELVRCTAEGRSSTEPAGRDLGIELVLATRGPSPGGTFVPLGRPRLIDPPPLRGVGRVGTLKWVFAGFPRLSVLGM